MVWLRFMCRISFVLLLPLLQFGLSGAGGSRNCCQNGAETETYPPKFIRHQDFKHDDPPNSNQPGPLHRLPQGFLFL